MSEEKEWDRSNNSSGYRGVFFDVARRKWKACIFVDKKTENIGRFKSKHDAARAYNKRALEVFGPDAFQNIIKEDT